MAKVDKAAFGIRVEARTSISVERRLPKRSLSGKTASGRKPSPRRSRRTGHAIGGGTLRRSHPWQRWQLGNVPIIPPTAGQARRAYPKQLSQQVTGSKTVYFAPVRRPDPPETRPGQEMRGVGGPEPRPDTSEALKRDAADAATDYRKPGRSGRR